MRRFRISLPFFSIVPISTGVLMLWSFFTIFNALRFLQCSPWVSLQKPPEDAEVLLGMPLHRLYVRTTSHSIYCLEKEQWSKCLLPPYELHPAVAPSWLISRLEANFQHGGVLQVIRSDSFFDVTYFSLLADRQLFACTINLNDEMENILRSGLFIWLLIPTVGIIWSSISFFDILTKYGQPTLWDFWGRGQRIK